MFLVIILVAMDISELNQVIEDEIEQKKGD
jgi:hypothetical protein